MLRTGPAIRFERRLVFVTFARDIGVGDARSFHERLAGLVRAAERTGADLSELADAIAFAGETYGFRAAVSRATSEAIVVSVTRDVAVMRRRHRLDR
jgi:hypothetical protein